MRMGMLLAADAMLAMTGVAAATEIEVKMLNKGSDGSMMVFET
jgi:hypothetical protein